MGAPVLVLCVVAFCARRDRFGTNPCTNHLLTQATLSCHAYIICARVHSVGTNPYMYEMACFGITTHAKPRYFNIATRVKRNDTTEPATMQINRQVVRER